MRLSSKKYEKTNDDEILLFLGFKAPSLEEIGDQQRCGVLYLKLMHVISAGKIHCICIIYYGFVIKIQPYEQTKKKKN